MATPTPHREPQTEQEATSLQDFLRRGATTTVAPITTVQPTGLVPTPLPATATVPLPATAADLAGSLAGAEDHRAMVEVEFDTITGAGDPVVLLFLTGTDLRPGAGADDPAFVGSVSFFFCHTQNGLKCELPGGKFRVRLDGTRAARNAGSLPAQLRAVLVPALVPGAPSIKTRPRVTAIKVDVVRSIVQ